LPDHSIEFDKGQITAIAPSTAPVPAPDNAGKSAIRDPQSAIVPDVIDGSRLLVIPGLVNTHHHLFQSLTRCHPSVQNAKLFDWLTRQYPIWRRMDYESLKLAATISMAEMLLGGATTTSDHQYLFPRGSDVRIEAVLEA